MIRKSIFQVFLFFLFTQTANAQWVLSNGNTNNHSWSMVKNDTSILAGATNGIYFTEDYGVTWLFKSCPVSYVRSIVVRDSSIFISGDFDGVYKSADNGVTWLSVDSGIVNPSQVWSLAQNDSLLILGTSGSFAGDTASVYISSDNGDLWTKVFSLGIYDVFYSFAVSGNEIFAGVLPSGVFYSDDKGVSWTLQNILMPAKHIAIADTHLLCGVSGGSGGIYLSVDKGFSWVNVLPLYYGYAFASSGIYTFTGTSNGFYYSTNHGYSWINDNTGLPPLTHIYSICVADSFVFISATSGIYRRNLTEFSVGVTDISGPQPVFEVFPNPSNGKFTIHSSLSMKYGIVEIYNTFGSILSKSKFQPTLNIELNPNEISSGIYYVKLYDDERRFYRKIIIE